MKTLSTEYIQQKIAPSDVIFHRGVKIFEHGSFICKEATPDVGRFIYDVDGNFGDYVTQVQLLEDGVNTSCDCPFPGKGCKHTVAALLDVQDRLGGWQSYLEEQDIDDAEEAPYLTSEEIRQQALEDRGKRANSEEYKIIWGDMFKGEHLIETDRGRQYTVTLHAPGDEVGHCTCPDFLTNRLDTCKHLINLCNQIKNKRGYKTRINKERFPFVDIFWDSTRDQPRLFNELSDSELRGIKKPLTDFFDLNTGLYKQDQFSEMIKLLSRLKGDKRVQVQDTVLLRLDDVLHERELEKMSKEALPSLDIIKTKLYPYQEEGVKFGLHKKALLIGDEMGLGKTLQAITLCVLKKQLFGFNDILVITMASLKEQWRREIERFSDETAAVVAGTQLQREAIYKENKSFFKITNYEAVLRDVTILSRYKPDLIILDEAQRIKNFTTKTADAVKNLPRKHSMVLTGTPLENKLEDVYSIIQFLDPQLLSPLWRFAATHFMLSREKKGKILGYRNLNQLHEQLKAIVIRRKKKEVLKDLPDEVVNNYYIDLSDEQRKMHNGYLSALIPLLHKKFLTPMDLRRIQELLLKMRMVCNSTYLIDRKTNISPKLNELTGILDELVIQNNRKVVIFSEWTTMTFLIAKLLSRADIPFVELSGKVPVKKRQALIDEFSTNPECKVFLSTDAGGTGLNLQAADCVINLELPWNPARLNQRTGRVNRIGQKSKCVNVVNLIAKDSIEEKILTGIQLKTDLFKGVFDGESDVVEFSNEKRTELLNRLRKLMGEEPEPVPYEPRDPKEIPEDTPHYLNPKVLQEAEEEGIPYDAEEGGNGTGHDLAEDRDARSKTESAGENILAGQSPEKVEQVLNSGMEFIGNLLEMATGEKMETIDDDQKMVKIDKNSGEVTMKFKLPGF